MWDEIEYTQITEQEFIQEIGRIDLNFQLQRSLPLNLKLKNTILNFDEWAIHTTLLALLFGLAEYGSIIRGFIDGFTIDLNSTGHYLDNVATDRGMKQFYSSVFTNPTSQEAI